MLKHLILFLISLSFVVSTIGCTSSEPEREDSSADVEMADAIDSAAEEGVAAAEGEDPFASDFGGDEEVVGDLGSEDLAPSGDASAEGGGEDPFAEGGDDDFAFDEGGGDDLAADDFGDVGESSDSGDVPMEEAFGGEDTAVADELPAEDMGTQETFSEPVTDTGPEDFAAEDTGMEMGDDSTVMDDSFQETPEKTWVPIKKIADAPFRKNGILINAVYIARKGDTIESIAQKIYGSDRSDDLYTANPSFRSSTLDTGEKVYYNSPNRPNDDSMLKTFYEDVGLAPETYIAQEGDNIRAVSKKLLGENDSWKEVWATNPDVESKAEISGGTALRYWASTDVGTTSPPVAASELPPEPAMDDLPPPPADDEPPSMPDMAANDAPPPPPPEPPSIEPPPSAPDMGANDSSPGMGSVDPPPPPPPPPSAMGSVEPPPPPPPPPSMAKKRLKADSGADSLGDAAQQEQVMMIAIGAALVFIALILFIIIRKKKARRQIDFNTATQTQIE